MKSVAMKGNVDARATHLVGVLHVLQCVAVHLILYICVYIYVNN